MSPANEEENGPSAAVATPATDELTIATYFRELAESSRPLAARDEARLARAIRDGYVELWAQLFCHPPFAPRLIDRALEVWPRDRELRALRAAAARLRTLRTSAARATFERRAQKLAPALWRRDRDRVVLGELLALAHALAGKSKAAGVARYLRRIHDARAAADGARQELVRRNLRLVVAVARRYRGSGVSFADLIQDGNLGLLKAVDRFDIERGFRFSTYGSWWIRHAIGRALADRGRVVRQPVHRIAARHRLARARTQLSQELGHAPGVDELARATGLSERQVAEALQPRFERGYSLDQPTDVEGGRSLHETLADEDGAERSAPELLARSASLRQLGEAIDKLKPIEAAILRKRFGIPDGKEDEERTLADIAREYRLSRERIRQIQEQALVKLRKLLERAEAGTASRRVA